LCTSPLSSPTSRPSPPAGPPTGLVTAMRAPNRHSRSRSPDRLCRSRRSLEASRKCLARAVREVQSAVRGILSRGREAHASAGASSDGRS
jgi:hypothetical protein